MAEQINIGIIGASGYTGADLIRLLATHPYTNIKLMTANSHAGKKLSQVFPHLSFVGDVDLVANEDANWEGVDVAMSGLPHATAQQVIDDLPGHLRVVDMSADFRFEDVKTYAQWYGHDHQAPGLQKKAVYGLTEYYREEIAQAQLAACPGCYPTAALLGLLPLVRASLIDVHDIIIDAKSGVSGAGRGLKEDKLFSEVAEGIHPYGIASHRHAPEIEKELAKVVGQEVIVNFTPHLMPMNRGEFLTMYVRMTDGVSASDLRAALRERYAEEPFVMALEEGAPTPATRHVRGSNFCLVAVYQDRVPGRAIVMSTLDNLVKGSSGQAVQNLNLMFGFEETTGLMQQPLFP